MLYPSAPESRENVSSLHERVVAAIGQYYELDGEIGRGGMSVVYSARDLRLKRQVAIKVLPPELAFDPAVRPRFTREAQTSAHLSHPNIVPIYDVGDREGIAFLVMAYVTGGNLASLLASAPRLPIEEVRRLLTEVSDALAYAHLRGVIHRDIKPDNILLDRESGRAMVTDFGIARAIEAGSRLTLSGVAVGTPTYMSPEQAVGEREIDGRSDIYSLGIVAYQMLTGRVPFNAGNPMALLLKHVSETARPIGDLRPDTPRGLREIVERAMMKSPEDRWPTAASMRDALTAKEGSSVSWRPEPREPVRYDSPKPEGARRDRVARESTRVATRPSSPKRDLPAPEPRPAVPAVRPAKGEIVMEQEHLAALTPEQRKDIRLWHGRVNLFDRVKHARLYFWGTLWAFAAGFTAFAFGIEEEIPPLVFGPIVPFYMTVKMWRRGRSLRLSGLKMRRVLLMPRAKWVIPTPAPAFTQQQLEKLAPREILESPQGIAIRRAAEDRTAILHIVESLPKPDRELIPDLVPTVNGLVERVAHLAQMVHRLDQSLDPGELDDVTEQLADAESATPSPEGERRLTLMRRQRESLQDLVQRRTALARQLDNAGLALGNLRLDLIKLRSSGVQSALSDVSTATQEARALSREIGAVLAAAAEVRSL
jgi:serine/threonine protein kinase